MQAATTSSTGSNTRNIALELFVVSLLSLYAELLVIRWMSCDIRAFSVFRTFPLVTCFVGLGVGFALGNDRIYRLCPLALLVFVGMMKLSGSLSLGLLPFPTVSIYYWDQLLSSTFSPGTVLYLGMFMLLLILVLVGPFALCACIGSRLGVLFNQLPALNGYCINIAGALAGSLLYAGLSYLGWGPAQQTLLLLGVLTACLIHAYKSPGWLPAVALAATLGLTLFEVPCVSIPFFGNLLEYRRTPTTTYWSPYQRLDTNIYESTQSGKAKLIGVELAANRSFHQYFFADNVDQSLFPKDVADLFVERQKSYQLPFDLIKQVIPASATGVLPINCLIVGSGMGQNVNAALANGIAHIDAVEIDPLILKLGKQFNPHYADARVTAYCDDARHFFGTTKNKYDLVVFPVLDSHAVTGQGSSVRIDSYVYTREALAKTMSLLKPGGIVVISFGAIAPWIGDRLYYTFADAAGYPPLVLRLANAKRWGVPDLTYVLGDKVKAKSMLTPPGWDDPKLPQQPQRRILTDDWPYLYINPDILDVPYLLVISEVLLLSAFAARKFLFAPADSRSWQMFFLGAAFLLLELHAISFLCLLYGSTWLTSAIVINGILIMILIANLFVIKCRSFLVANEKQLYFLLFASILASFFLPGGDLVSASGNATFMCALVTLVTLLPMCFAGVIFATAFSQVPVPATALAFNLFGAVVGGMLEYVSNFVGINLLQLLALVLYTLSLLAILRTAKNIEPGSGTT